jgi:hypothetical protein
MRGRWLTWLALALVAIGVAGAAWLLTAPGNEGREPALVLCPANQQCRHIHDVAGVLPAADIPRFDQYMEWIQQESDIDVRLVFLPSAGNATLEQLAVAIVDQLRIGGRNREQRGVLFLFDMQAKRLKVEVGYGLEAYLPDLFVSYLVDHHARMFFERGDLTTGLHLLLRLMQFRIREAVLGDDFDPRVLEGHQIAGSLSGGAGVTTSMTEKAQARPKLPDAERATYFAGDSVQATYTTYMRWLSQPVFDPDIDVFTGDSRRYLSGLPISPAYADYLRIGEVAKQFRITERGDLAMLVFASTPFTSPHFFIRENGKWRMDIIAEVRNTQEITGGEFTWLYRGKDDAFTQAFADLLTDIRGYRRFKEGDNRPLPVRKSAATQPAGAAKP